MLEILAFLSRMQDAGYSMCVASGNKIEAIEYLLDRIGARHFFPIIVTNKDVHHPKPSPEIFLTAAERLGLPPEQCVVFEDAVNGVLAARAAQIRAIALATRTPEDNLRHAGADFVVKSYDDVGDEMLS